MRQLKRWQDWGKEEGNNNGTFWSRFVQGCQKYVAQTINLETDDYTCTLDVRLTICHNGKHFLCAFSASIFNVDFESSRLRPALRCPAPLKTYCEKTHL
jgi:hypothetical protein